MVINTDKNFKIQCNSCKIYKSIDQFHKNNKNKNGVSGKCKECTAIYDMDRRGNPIPKKDNYKFKVPQSDPSYMRRKSLKRDHGITLEEFEEMERNQNYVCAICGNKESSKGKNTKIMNLSVDHCHNTGKIRGLLCTKCNWGIGLIQDNPKLLLNAAKYLIKSRILDNKNELEIFLEINKLFLTLDLENSNYSPIFKL
jgi:hypothetical protein